MSKNIVYESERVRNHIFKNNEEYFIQFDKNTIALISNTKLNKVPELETGKTYGFGEDGWVEVAGGEAPNYGDSQRIPFMNYGGTAFQYNDDFQYNGSELYLKRFSSTTQYSTLSGARLWIQHESGQNITLGHEGSSATGGNSPQLSGTNSINDTAEALSIRATIGSGNDTGLIPAMTIISGQVAGNALAVRPIVGVYNSSTKVLEVAADGTISVESNLIKNVLDPVDAQDAATKAYADSVGGGAGDVTKVGTPVNNQLGIWTGDGTIKGDTNLTFNGSSLVIGTGGNSNLLNSNGLLINNNSNQLVANTSTISHFTGGGAGAIVVGYYTGAASREALLLEASLNSGQDSGAVPVTVIGSRLHTGAVVATRPTLAGYNNTTKQWEVAANGDWDYQGNLLKNLADPVDAQDAATKAYADSVGGDFLPIAGGTLTGNLEIDKLTPSLTFSDNSHQWRLLGDGLEFFIKDLTLSMDLLRFDGAGTCNLEQGVSMANIPTSDPNIVGQLWNNAGVLNVSI